MYQKLWKMIGSSYCINKPAYFLAQPVDI